MAEYIDRDKAIKAVYDNDFEGYATWAIKAIPAADVRPVINCGECKHSDTFSPDCAEATFPLKCLSIRYGGVYPNWFCEHGEKREES